MKKYFDYDAEGFASCESFQNWYYKRNESDIAFWEEWLDKNRLLKHAEIDEAIDILHAMEFRAESITRPVEVDRSWEQLKLRVEDTTDDKKVIRQPGTLVAGHLWNRKFALGVAAAITLLIVGTLTVRDLMVEGVVSHQTGFGETLSVTLPDNSTATLNSNSSITYKSSWAEGMEREVWLDGEAYFSVVHTPDHQKFYVKASNGVEVEVLGTEFNITKRKTRTRVVLNSGKIRLNIERPELHQEVTMSPGELVEFRDTSRTYLKKVVNPELYTSWRCNKLMFERTPLREVIMLLEENYGLEVEVADPDLLEKEVSGSVPNNNTNLLMEGLSESFNLDIVWTKNHVTIKTR